MRNVSLWDVLGASRDASISCSDALRIANESYGRITPSLIHDPKEIDRSQSFHAGAGAFAIEFAQG